MQQIQNMGEYKTRMKPFRLFSSSKILLFMLPVCMLSSCFIYSKREPALVKNMDVDQTIRVARDEMQKTGMGQSLGIWVLRDQVVTPKQAKEISDLYLAHIDSMTSPFNIWHSSWAISNLYRLGDTTVKSVLATAYQKAKQQPERLEGEVQSIAEDHINGKKPVTGFIHLGGLFYAYGHVVAPGNKKYLQSYEEYREGEENQ